MRGERKQERGRGRRIGRQGGGHGEEVEGGREGGHTRSVALPAIDTDVEDIVELIVPPCHCRGIRIVHEGAMTMPPLHCILKL